MKKRLRRKLRLAEFQELGFEITVRFNPGVDDEGVESFLDRLVETVEARELIVLGATVDGGFTGTVVRNHRGSTDEGDREHVRAMLEKDPGLAEQKVGPLVDAWHGPNAPIRAR